MIESTEVTSARGVVAANPPTAARVGAAVLESGGNAFDAAVAAGFICCMQRPNQTGVGGYVCSAVVREGRTGKVWSVDANGEAPAAAHERMFEVLAAGRTGLNEQEYFCSVRDNANVHGPLSITVPGQLAGMGAIHERWGKLPWARIIEPSLELLERGFPYEEVAYAAVGLEAVLRRYPASWAHLAPAGQSPRPDEIWHRPDMEKTLRRLAQAGWRDFYEGQLGRQIADSVAAAGGILTRQDMASYQPRFGEPHCIGYLGARVHTPVLPNGGISTLAALNMLECLDLPGEDSPLYWHLLGETLKLVWRDRLNTLADPAFCDVPIQRLLSKDYAAGRVETIRRFPAHVDRLLPSPQPDAPNGTLHVSSADSQGNLVAMTISQGAAFGSCFVVPGTGLFLGHGMCRLDPRPDQANSIRPGKRPLNNTAAMMIETPDPRSRAVAIGVPGGRTIISNMARTADLIVRRSWTARQAAAAPRLHVEIKEPIQLLSSVEEPTIEALRAMGHEILVAGWIGSCMNGAEFLHAGSHTRGGSGESAAGAQ